MCFIGYRGSLRPLFDTGTPRLWIAIICHCMARLRIQLTALDSAAQAKDVNVPGWKLHELSEDRAGFLSVAVSGNWRLIFRCVEKDIELVDYLDYH